MRDAAVPKQTIWMGGSLDALRRFPDPARHIIGYALYLAQTGSKHRDAKPLKGLGGPGVLEMVDDYDGDTYRAVYTVRFRETVYVLHVFQKKSKKGIATPKHDLDIIKERLKAAAGHYAARKEHT